MLAVLSNAFADRNAFFYITLTALSPKDAFNKPLKCFPTLLFWPVFQVV